MSSMLEQAIIDAEQLKETAKKAAEEAVIEKYQPEIKEALEKILEQDEIGFGEEIEEDAALVTDGEGGLDLVEDLPTAQLAKEGEIVEIDLYKLEEMMAEELAEEGRLDPDDLVEREKLAEEIDEEVNISEEELKEILDGAKVKKVDVVSYKSKYAMVCPRCGSAYPLDYYRCTEGFLVLHDSNGNGFAKRCRDTKNEDLGPLLVKEELLPFEKGLFF